MVDPQFPEFVSIQLSRKKNTPLYVQLYDQISKLIRERMLSPGRPLPPVRQLASLLSVNPGTVVSAYRELERNGYILTRGGSGSFIAETPDTSAAATAELTEETPLPGAIDMSRISLNRDIISISMFKSVIDQVLDRDGIDAFTYPESQGYRPLRDSMAAVLAGKGIRTSSNHIQIVSGAQQGIDIVARALLQHGDFVVTETPTYPGATAVFRACGAHIADVPVCADGADMDRLEKTIRRFRPRLLYLMPDIQNPTGISWSPMARTRLMGLAKYYDFYILEDDYAGGLHYGKRPLKPLKAMDHEDRVLYLRSVSALFMPGLRLAFLTMPAALSHAVRNVKYISDIATSGLAQRVFDLYLRNGLWQKHITSLRSIYGAQLKFTLQAAKTYLPPDVSWIEPAGGLSVWITLPGRLAAADIIRSARTAGLLLQDGAPFYVRRPPGHEIRLSFALPTLPEIEQGMDILGRLCRKK